MLSLLGYRLLQETGSDEAGPASRLVADGYRPGEPLEQDAYADVLAEYDTVPAGPGVVLVYDDGSGEYAVLAAATDGDAQVLDYGLDADLAGDHEDSVDMDPVNAALESEQTGDRADA